MSPVLNLFIANCYLCRIYNKRKERDPICLCTNKNAQPEQFEVDSEQFELCLNAFRRVKDNWPQPTGRNPTRRSLLVS